MEIFVEEMVRKKKTVLDFVAAIGAITAGALLALVLIFVVSALVPALSGVILLLAAGCVYGAYFLMSMTNVEYEYSLVNNEMDIDKIISRKRRKRVTTANFKELEAFGTAKNPDFERYIKNPSLKKVYAAKEKQGEDLFFLVYTENSVKKMLLFSPSEKIISVIAKYNPKKELL